MPNITYFTAITHRDRDEIEYCEFTKYDEARYHFDLFDSSDADIYSRIELCAYNWKTRIEIPLASKFLNPSA